MTDSFPRQQARTQRFTLGVPRSFRVSPDGSRVAFLRSKAGTDPVTCLWVLDVSSGQQRLVADPAAADGTGGDIPAAERARRERSREQAGGIVAYATDASLTMAAFALAGRVYVADLLAGPPAVRQLPARAPALDPRPDPAGKRVGYVCEGALRVTDAASGEDWPLADPAGTPGLSYGLAEFIAAEEMGRMNGYWWAPDGTALLVASVDETPVNRWHIADPANPGRPPARVSYPAAGTPNAAVSLLLVGLDGRRQPVHTDRGAFPYLVTVCWDEGSPLIVVQSRDQRRMRLLTADPVTGATEVLREDTDPRWLDIVPGVPARAAGGRIVWTETRDGARRLLVATPQELSAGRAAPVTPATLQVREVLGVDGEVVLLRGSAADPTEIGVWAYRPAGLTRIAGGQSADLGGQPADLGGQPGHAGGLHSAVRSAGTTVLTSQRLSDPGVTVEVFTESSQRRVASIASLAERPLLPAGHIDVFRAGPREIAAALLLPSWHQPGSARLPVLLDPYGGPHAQRVLAARDAFLTSQWLAEQGFAVLVADGRGTPGRGPEWDRAVCRDLAGPVLEDQVEALLAARERCPDLDTDRVAIRGWSFGGYLAALAVLRRPDVFHAAIAGAPVTDWRLYDTHYTERYLGDPAADPAAYASSSLLADAHRLSRPLLLIHGLADDNVVAAHTLRLSAALLAAGCPHEVLPLPGVTHMTPQEDVAENLLLLQMDFLRRALGISPGEDRGTM